MTSSMAVSRLQTFIRPRPRAGFHRDPEIMEAIKAKHPLSITATASGADEECVCGKVMKAGLMQAHRPVCAVYGRDQRRTNTERIPSEERRRRRHNGLR